MRGQGEDFFYLSFIFNQSYRQAKHVQIEEHFRTYAALVRGLFEAIADFTGIDKNSTYRTRRIADLKNTYSGQNHGVGGAGKINPTPGIPQLSRLPFRFLHTC